MVYYDSIKIALAQSKENFPEQAWVENAAADLLHVKINDNRPAVMALAFIEQQQYKWISRDGILLVKNNDVVVRTAGLAEDVLFSSPPPAPPSSIVNNEPAGWRRMFDSTSIHQVETHSTFSAPYSKPMTLWERSLVVDCIDEKVTIATSDVPSSNVIREWMNTYCYASGNGPLLSSTQYLFPGTQRLDMLYLSRAQRLIFSTEQAK